MNEAGKNGNICLFFALNKENPPDFSHSWKYAGTSGGGVRDRAGRCRPPETPGAETKQRLVPAWGGGEAFSEGGGTLEVPL